MATSKLSLWNGALRLLGERKLVSVTEEIEARYVMMDIWDDDALKALLESGQWNFAGRTVKLDYSPSISPDFGYQFAFPKPDDFVRTMKVCHDEYFATPLLQYQDEATVIFTDAEELYFQYVSIDPQWGADFSLWPSTFTKWAESWMALEAAPKITHSDELYERVQATEKRRLIRAKSNDAMESPTQFAPEGRWAATRRGPRGNNRDRGSRTRLMG